jgi:membrane protease subunit HflC
MEASRNFARKSTTMVLPADSPLFGVLLDSDYFNGSAAGNHDIRRDLPKGDEVQRREQTMR